MVFKDVCSGEDIDTENKSCKSAEEKEIKVFDQGVLVSSETCYRGRDGSCEFNRKIEYDSDKKGHYRMILSDYAVTDYTYDDDKLTSIKICSKRNGMSADGQSCDRYYGIEDYAYDQSGRQISHRICRDQDISADGKTCDKYSEEYEYGYDIVGNLVSIRDKGWYYDKNCEYVLAIKDYSYDAAGNVTSVKKCNLYNVQLGTDRKSCDKYNETVAYNYDAAGNRTSIIIERPTLRGPVNWPSYRMHLAGPWAEYYLQCFGDEAGGKEKLADPAHWKKPTASSIWLDTGF